MKKGGVCGVIIGCSFLVAAIGGFGWFMYQALFTNSIAKMMGEETVPVTGDTSNWDPIEGIGQVKKQAGAGAQLVRMTLSSIRSDGTMELTASYTPSPKATYELERRLPKAPNGKTEPPIGAGRTPDSVWVERVNITVSKPDQTRHVKSVGGGVSKEYNYKNEGMEVDRSSQLTKPGTEITLKPSPKEMWSIALKAGAPKNAVAQISYDGTDAKFNINGVLSLRWEGGKLDEFFLDDKVKEKLGIPK